ncbi:MAG: hypothetical protein ACP5FZ_06015 [Fidelibacterota bacterium]
MKKVGLLVISVAIILSSSCMMKLPEESDMPSWNVNLEIPLVKTTVTLADLLEDSLFVGVPYGLSGDSIFAYEDQVDIEKVEVGDQLNIDDIQQVFSQSIDDVRVKPTTKQYISELDPVGVDPVSESVLSELGNISLDDTDPKTTDPVLMSEIVDFSGVNEDQQVTIQQGTDFPTVYRNITFEDFDNADFASGVLEITVDNDLMNLELGAPLVIRILNSDSLTIVGSDGDSAKAVWSSGIMLGTSGTQTIDLAHKILPETVIIKISGVLNGSDASTVTNNSAHQNSGFVVGVQAKNLEVVSAEAMVPSQTIDTTDVILLEESEDKVKTARILNGTLAIDVTNDIPINSTLELTISSIDISEAAGIQAYTQSINLTADQDFNNADNLTGYYLVMDVNSQQVDYSYQVITEDTGTERVTISKNDGVLVDIQMYGQTAGEQLTFDEFEGIVTQDPINDNGEIDVTTDSEISSALISSGTMTINIYNTANTSDQNVPELTLDIPEILDPAANPIHIERNLYPEPNTTTIQIDLSGYTLHPNTIPVTADSISQNITYASTVEIPSGVITAYDLRGAYDVNIAVSELLFSEVTGYFSQDAIVERDSIALAEATKIQEAYFNTGELALSIVNNIGAIAEVKFRVKELIHKDTNAPLQQTIQLTEDSQPVDRIIPLEDYKIVIPTVDFSADQQIHYRSTVSLPSDQEMTLYVENEIDVNLDLRNISFSSVEGYIDTVTIDIDSVEQEITALPEELDGIDLNEVEIQINFDSDIGVPVILDLNLVSSNKKGERAESHVHQNITDNPVVVIPNAADLINLKPDKIVSYGSASIGGTGYVATDQSIQGVMEILVPMSFEVEEGASIDIEPELVEDDIPEELDEVALFANLDNQLELNGILKVLGARDTLYFASGSPVNPDTLAIFHLIPDSAYQEMILLDETKFALFQDSLYIKTKIDLLSNTDDLGNPVPTRLFKNDSLTIQLYSRIKGLIDLADKDN